MLLDRHRDRLLLLAALAAGFIGWSGSVFLLPAAMAFPAIWSLARTRTRVAIYAAGYFLSASRGLPQGVATYYATDLWPGLILWVGASASFVLVHAVLWTEGAGWQKAIRYLVACTLMAIPPFGISGWANPLTVAGILFPGQGWLGLILTAAGLAALTTRHQPAAAIILCGLWLWSAAVSTDIRLPEDWRGVEVKMGSSLGRVDLMQQHDLFTMVRETDINVPGVIALPEAALGFWTPTLEHFWRRELADTNVTLLAGALIADATGYDNVVVGIDHRQARILYRQRMPVPIAMWQPWRGWLAQSGGAHAHGTGQPIQTVSGKRVAVLICYEQLLVWPILQSMIDDPDIIVAIGNGWWTSGTSIVSVQRTATRAWARLFGKPVIFSFNT